MVRPPPDELPMLKSWMALSITALKPPSQPCQDQTRPGPRHHHHHHHHHRRHRSISQLSIPMAPTPLLNMKPLAFLTHHHLPYFLLFLTYLESTCFAAAASSPATTPTTLTAADVPECGRDCLVQLTNLSSSDTTATAATSLCEDDIEYYLAVLKCVRAECTLEESMGLSCLFFSFLLSFLPTCHLLIYLLKWLLLFVIIVDAVVCWLTRNGWGKRRRAGHGLRAARGGGRGGLTCWRHLLLRFRRWFVGWFGFTRGGCRWRGLGRMIIS